MPRPAHSARLAAALLLTALAAPTLAQETAAPKTAGACTIKAQSATIALLICPEGLDQLALAEAGKAACGETRPCGAWFWTDAAKAPETAPDNHDGLNQEQVTSSLGVWVNEDQQLISITPTN